MMSANVKTAFTQTVKCVLLMQKNTSLSVMNKREKTLILSYLYNNYTRLEQQLRQLQFNVRYRSIDEVDCLELLIAAVQFDLFKDVSSHIREILKLESDNE